MSLRAQRGNLVPTARPLSKSDSIAPSLPRLFIPEDDNRITLLEPEHSVTIAKIVPYIGITGFCSQSEVESVLETLPAEPSRLLMCGVLLSNALLSGDPSGAPNRCPSPDGIAAIFSNDSRCVNLVHYRPQPGADLADALTRASEVGGPNCHGVQINATRGAPWPDPAALATYRERCHPSRIVFQAGREAMESANHQPDELARRCAEYSGLVTDVLVDASEGLGLPLDAARSANYLHAIRPPLRSWAWWWPAASTPATSRNCCRPCCLSGPPSASTPRAVSATRTTSSTHAPQSPTLMKR